MSNHFQKKMQNTCFLVVKLFILISFLVSQLFLPEILLYKNNSGGHFVSTASAADDSWYDANWLYRKAIVIDHNKISNIEQSNFPVLISAANNDFKTVTNGGKVNNTNGYDIIFTNQDGSARLDYEIESYDGAAGSIIMWVKVPALSALVDTVIYVYYGNANINASQENKTQVWDDGGANNFKGVWHMNQNPSDTAPQIKDSTASANDGTANGGMTVDNEVTGKIGNGISFNGEGNYVSVGDSSSLNITDNITVEAWINPSSSIISPSGNPIYSEGSSRPDAESETGPENTINYDNSLGSLNISDSWVAYDLWSQWAWDFGSLADRNFYIKWNAVANKNTTYTPNITYSIEASSDNSNWTTVKSLNYTSDVNSPVYIDGIQGNYRYIRAKIYSSAASISGNCSLNVYGVWAEPSSVSKDSSYGIGANTSEIFGKINNSFVTASPVNAGWNHVVLTYTKDGGDGNEKIYVNGELKNSITATGTINSAADILKIAEEYFSGQIDEVRVSNVARSDDWIKTEYNNVSSPATFFTMTDNVTEQMDRLTLTGSASQVAGDFQTVTITAVGTMGNVFSGYAGDKIITLTGANSIGSYIPVFTDKNGQEVPFGSQGIVSFTNGIASTNIKLYKAETVEVEASDGTYNSAGHYSYDLDVTVSPQALNRFDITAPAGIFPGIPFSLSLTSLDVFGNITKNVIGDTSLSVSAGAIDISSVPNSDFTDNGLYAGNITIQKITEGQSLTLTVNNGSVSNTANLSAISSPSGKVYYVDSSGSDSNDGLSASTPWKSIQKAADIAVAGDTVNISGTFTLTSLITIAHSGNETDGWIKFLGHNNATLLGDGNPTLLVDGAGNPILDANGHQKVVKEATVSAFRVPDRSAYIQFDGFRIFNVISAFGAGKYSHHLAFKNNYVKNHSGTGIGTWSMGHDIIIDNNHLEGLTIGDGIWNARAIFSFGYPYTEDNFINNVAITNNTIKGGGHNCIDIHTRNHNILIENNNISDCDHAAGIMLHNFGNENITIRNNHISGAPRAIEVAGTTNIAIEDNVLATGSVGILFLDFNVAGDALPIGNTITNCAESSAAIVKNNTITNTQVYARSVEFSNICNLSDPDPAFSNFTFEDNNFINKTSQGDDIWTDEPLSGVNFLNSRDYTYGDISYTSISTGGYMDSSIRYSDNTVLSVTAGNSFYRYYPTYAEEVMPEDLGSNIHTQVYPMTITPSAGYLEVAVNNIDPTIGIWDVTVSSSVPENPTNFVLKTSYPNTVYNIGAETVNTDEEGNLTYYYQTEGNEYDATHQFEFISTGLPVAGANALTVNQGSGTGYYMENQTVAITANSAPAGQVFDKWTGDIAYISDVNSAAATVTMPAQAITLTATYKDIPIASSPIFSLPAGIYTSPQIVALSTSIEGATIYYTLNGADPTPSSPIYFFSLHISSSATLKAIAVKDGYINSSAVTSSYTISTSSGGSGSSGGSSGGSGSSTPTIGKLEITKIAGSQLTLSLAVTNASRMMIGTDGSFTGSSWLIYSPTYTYTKTENQTKIYLKFKSSAGIISKTYELDIPVSGSNGMGSSYPTGTLLKTSTSFKIYVMIEGKKKWIPTPEVFEQLGYKWSEIKILTDTELNAISDYEDNLIRTIGDYKVYLVVNGVKRHIPDPEVFLNYGFSWNEVKDVEQTVVDKYKDTYLLKQSGRDGISYVNSSGVRKLIPSDSVFKSYNDKYEEVQVISAYEMGKYPLSNLIKLGGSNDIYFLEGNIKRRISSVEVFNAYHLNWNYVMNVNQTEFDFYQDGGELR